MGLMVATAAVLATGRPRAVPVHRFSTAALGARVSIALYGLDDAEARRLAGSLVDELLRLEAIFTLHRPDAPLVRLAREGRLALPPPELLEALALARLLYEESEGAFDPTVQPLYTTLARLAGAGELDDPLRVAHALDGAWGAVGFGRVDVTPTAVRLPPDAALTLDGIAQGVITDRLAASLQRQGLGFALLDCGELRALGPPPGDEAFAVALRSGGRLRLRDEALAVSAPAATRFDVAGRWHHILDPRTGRPARGIRRAVVRAETAALADGLATALCVLEPEAGRALAARFGAWARIETVDGRIYETGTARRWRVAATMRSAISGRRPTGPV